MATGIKSVLLAGGVLLTGVLAGCGLFSRDDEPAAPAPSAARAVSPLRAPLRANFATPGIPSKIGGPLAGLHGISSSFGLYPASVTPDCGPLAGGTPVRISGDFSIIPSPLDAAAAAQAYKVYFGHVEGTFDSAYDPNVVTSTDFRVITPAGPTTGLVDVSLWSIADGYYGNLANAYTYYEPFVLDFINPVSGPMTGGTQVTITAVNPTGLFPIHQSITTAAQAATFYRVRFDGAIAAFDDSSGDPITALEMKVYAPVSAIPDVVDITVEEIGVPCNSDTLPDAYTYTGLDITDVDPAFGYTKGGLPVTLTGDFPIAVSLNAVDAENAFTVYFDGVPATFDASFDPAMTPTEIRVISPAHLAPGLGIAIDVMIEEDASPTNTDTATGAFEYVALEILSVIPVTTPVVLPIDPESGTSSGGTAVKITAFISIGADITTLVAADLAYLVYFGDDPLTAVNLATFDGSESSLVVAPTSEIPDRSAPDRFEKAAAMYVLTPLGTGIVDVLVVDVNNTTGIGPPFIESRRVDGYEYTDGLVGDWVGVRIMPEYVGALDPGELVVYLETTEDPTVVNNLKVFVVPQGGDPADTDHQIGLKYVGPPLATSPNYVTKWVSTEPISTLIEDNGAAGINDGDVDLFADGHAAVYIDDGAGVVYGDDFSSLTDGGLIEDNSDPANAATYGLVGAINGRHFLIDTIPPKFEFVPDPASGRNLVILNSGSGGLTGYAPAFMSDEHPVDPNLGDTGTERNTQTLIDDVGQIDSSATGTNGAQVFLNTASDDLTNTFAADDLDIIVRARFVDEDLHTHFGISTTAFDEDGFDANKTFRQPSGFPTDINTVPLDYDRADDSLGDSVLGGPIAHWAQWYRAPGSDTIPLSILADVTFTASTAGATPVANPSNPGYFDYSDTMEVEWDFDTTTTNGIPEPAGSNAMHWAIQFRAHDRGGYVTDTAFPASFVRHILASETSLHDPLHIWWIRHSGARIVPNIEGDEVFDAVLRFELDRGFDIALDDTQSTNVEPLPVFAYNVWRSTVPGRGGYDGPYEELAASWTDFLKEDQISVQTDIAGLAPSPVNRWVLIQVLGIDEAGNYGQFPVDELDYDQGTGAIDEVLASGGTSWMRFYLMDDAGRANTECSPTLWYDGFEAALPGFDGAIDPNEEVVQGAPTLVQQPENISTRELHLRFDVKAIVGNPDDLGTAQIEWSVRRQNGTLPPHPSPDLTGLINLNGNNTAVINFSRTGVGFNGEVLRLDTAGTNTESTPDPAYELTGNPTELVFSFRTIVNPGVGQIEEGSPCMYRVTVVEDVEEFVENRESRDQQPVKETER